MHLRAFDIEVKSDIEHPCVFDIEVKPDIEHAANLAPITINFNVQNMLKKITTCWILAELNDSVESPPILIKLTQDNPPAKFIRVQTSRTYHMTQAEDRIRSILSHRCIGGLIFTIIFAYIRLFVLN
jgi:hypothetical protein